MTYDPTWGGDIAASYDLWAETYDLDRNLTRDLDADVLRRSGPSVAGRDVLELGCGTGKNTAWLAAHARSVVAFDFSPGMIGRARDRIRERGVSFVEHDIARRWPLASSSVDVVVGNLVLEHLADLQPIFDEAARVLRPGGQYFLCELHPERQRAGRRAEFLDPSTGGTIQVAAFLHTAQEYVNGGLAAGMSVRHVGEFADHGAPASVSPRLFSVLFER